MKFSKSLSIIAAGLAMFSMFFGAGNVIFPLMIGFTVKEMVPFASFGLLIGAVGLPFLGLFSMILCDGDVNRYFNKLGKPFGFIVGFFTISLLGPLGASPRCIAFASSTLQASGLTLPHTLFCALACLVVGLLAMRKNKIIEVLGYFLTPILVLLLGIMMVKAILSEGSLPVSQFTEEQSFYLGLKEGYLTMDLLAALFFAPLILANLKQSQASCSLFKKAFLSSLIGGLLLALTYLGFSYAAAIHSETLSHAKPEALLSEIAFKILGDHAGIFISLLVTLACLTTAIALLSVFASFVETTFPKSWKISYEKALLSGILIAGLIATLEFKGITLLLGPILDYLYPIIILLALTHVAEYFWNKKKELLLDSVKGPDLEDIS